MLSVQEKKEIIKKFGNTETDSGSVDVQIGFLTMRINQLMEHFKRNKKDNNSKRGFFKLIGHRRRLLRYLSKENPEKYSSMIKELGIRK
jgi:small subunit ribosomal protein S15